MIKLIINADDFGMSKIFNEKILELLKKKFIKSTSVMINRLTDDQDKQIKKLIKLYDRKKISIGLHLEFDLERPLRTQIQEQYQKFTSIFGFKPTHLDIHKFPTIDMVKSLNNFAEKYNLAVRNMNLKSKTKQTSHIAFLPKKLDIDEIKSFIQNMKDGYSYELITHPGEYDPNCTSTLNEKRKIEYENIIAIQDFLKNYKNIKIISYLEL